jgi:hypothetical protein
MSGNLERRYWRVLWLLPGWYRKQWEQDMVAAFLDSWLTGAVLAIVAALVQFAPDAGRAQTAAPAPPRYPPAMAA